MFSLSSLPPKPVFLPLARPTASISSIKTIQGAFSLACLNRSRTRDAPTPTNISTKSDPEIEKNGTFASPATAFASKVFPVPGRPINNAPFGILPPRSVYFFGFFRKSTSSLTSIFASSNPATSEKSTFTCDSLSNNWAFDFPTLKILPAPPGPAPPPIRRKINNHTPTNKAKGRIHPSKSPIIFLRVSYLTLIISLSL